MEARAGSVHLIYSMDRNTPTTASSCSWRRPILLEILTDYQKLTISPQTRPIVQHSLINTKTHTMTSMTYPHHNHTTHFLHWWSKTTSTPSITLSSSQIVPTHSTWTGRPLAGQWRGVANGQRSRRERARPLLLIPHQQCPWAICTAHRLGTHQIRVNRLFF